MKRSRKRWPLPDFPAAPAGCRAHLLGDVAGLAAAIAGLRAALAAQRPLGGPGCSLPEMGDELDAVAAHTATAAHRILSACETLDALAQELGRLGPAAAAAALTAATVRIYEACSFQDIVGQRIAKIAAMLQVVDAWATGTLAAVGGPASRPHGPPLPGAAMAQGDVDRLLAAVP